MHFLIKKMKVLKLLITRINQLRIIKELNYILCDVCSLVAKSEFNFSAFGSAVEMMFETPRANNATTQHVYDSSLMCLYFALNARWCGGAPRGAARTL